MEELTDDSIMPFGKAHKGKRMDEVPADYLLYIHSNYNNLPTELVAYIDDNMDVLEQQANGASNVDFGN